MKRILLFLLVLVLGIGILGCGASDKNAETDDGTSQEPSVYTEEYVVIEATENRLLVAEIGQAGEVDGARQYSNLN